MNLNSGDMKKLISGIALGIMASAFPLTIEAQNTASIKGIIGEYLLLKNNLADDNSTGAAAAGKKMESEFADFNKTALTQSQKKTWGDVEAGAKENAEHIAMSGGNIAHQREHFVLLSKNIYDLVKAFGAGQVLYKEFDQMADEGKGAFWLSESKEIRNPYMGKSMLTSGSVKEEIK
jgi:hypothetical protein